jgi:hypothetical protein
LQVPDQMESRALAVCQRHSLGFELLDVILAEFPETKRVCFLDYRRRKFLGHRQHSDLGALSARARSRAFDPGFYQFQVFFEQSWSFVRQRTTIRVPQPLTCQFSRSRLPSSPEFL